ncbi:MAG TPA: cytochrome B6 [Gemmataceae bacterium]|nr:cytochrome B6 [Gemmataceae bacterium]
MRLTIPRLLRPILLSVAGLAVLLYVARPGATQPKDEKSVGKTSYDQVSPALVGQISFAEMMAKDKEAKPGIVARQKALLDERYDLTARPHDTIKMTRGKPIPVGPTARLSDGMTFEKLAEMSSDDIRDKGLFPKGYLPLPHPNHAAGGMLFPQHQIKQFARLERFDLDFDIPEPFLPEFPPAIFLTTRPDLGDVSQGKVVDINNFQEIFRGILNGKDLDGLRLLLTQFPQQQFNATADRKTNHPEGMKGVACLDCHLNGHTSGATHLVGDIRPQEHRRRIETPSLRGVNIQRLFGSQRSLKSVEDFTEFEQLAAYFDGDIVTSSAKGINRLDRGTQVHTMAEFQNLLDFPPAPALSWDGKLDPKKFSESTPEMKGQKLFFGKARCAECHPAPYYTDNTLHDLQVERFYKTQTINGLVATKQGPIKTFPLRGIKESPPYLHDGRLLTLEDTVEFFNIVLELKLTKEEKAELVAFLRVL